MDDRALFCAAFVSYYTDCESDRLWIADVDGTVVGYAMGCGDSRRRARALRSQIVPSLLWGILRGCYHIGIKTLRFGWRAAQGWLHHGRLDVSLDPYPGHLHINVAEQARGRGIGRALLERSLVQFWATGVRGVHLSTTDRNAVACHLYEMVGFRLLCSWPTQLWRGLVDGPVERRIYGILPGWAREAQSELAGSFIGQASPGRMTRCSTG